MLDTSTTINTRSLLPCLIILFLGISSGVFFGNIVPAPDRIQLSSMLLNSKVQFLPALITNSAALFLTILAGYTVYGFPLAFAVLLFRSFAVGFCDSLLLYNMKTGDLPEFIFSFMVPQLALCILYLMISASSTGYALSKLRK